MKNGKILFYSKYGKSRSVMFAIAYMIKRDNMTWFNAYNYVKNEKNDIEPQLEFLKQVELYSFDKN